MSEGGEPTLAYIKKMNLDKVVKMDNCVICNFFCQVKEINGESYCSLHYPKYKTIFPKAKENANKWEHELNDLRELISTEEIDADA
jgi:hypothetical protein